MLIRRNSEDIQEIKRMVKGLNLGLSHLMNFDSEYLVNIVCRDSRDRVILDVLLAVGYTGLSPKEIYAKVRRYGLKYHHIGRRIKRINRRNGCKMRLVRE